MSIPKHPEDMVWRVVQDASDSRRLGTITRLDPWGRPWVAWYFEARTERVEWSQIMLY